jgi:aspartyl-tRNA(Asn)/glutamyl-tRNA(Gln) amidotransferase subunit A
VPSDAQLWQLSAAELGAAYRDGSATPEDALTSVLTRLDAVNPKINAVVTLDRSGAQRAADESTQRWKEGRPLSPLDGVPVTIKDNILVGGMRATWGSRLYADYIPERDEEPVARLRQAGAVIIGKTNVPEFTLHGTTRNELFGVTRNPFGLALTPGGSSGGAAAAVASGIAPLALGTDGGGSIRRPAAHTGLVGFKPSTGIVPRSGGFPVILHDFEVAGLLTRSVGDCILAMNTIGGPRWWRSDGEGGATSLRILHVAAFGDEPVDAGIRMAVADVAARLASLGHRVMHAPRFNLARPVGYIWPVISCSGLYKLLSQHDGFETRIGPEIAELARRGAGYSAADYAAALASIAELRKSFDALFNDIDVLLTPATAAMPWPAEETHPPMIAGQEVGPRGHAVFTPFANVLGLPAISLPCPVAAGSLPIGVQLCMAKDRDAELLAFALACERAFAKPFAWPL